MAKTVLELQQLLQIKSTELHEFYEKRKTEKQDENGVPILDMSAEEVAEGRKRDAELNQIGKELDAAVAQESYLRNRGILEDLKGIDRTTPRPASAQGSSSVAYGNREVQTYKTLGERVVNSNDYKYKNTGNRHFGFEDETLDFKALITTDHGYAPANPRGPRVVDYPLRRPMVPDLIPQDPTNNTSIKWMEQTTMTRAAAAVSQSGTKPEAEYRWTERTSLVEKIAVWVPVTEEQVDDIPGFQGIVNNQLITDLMLEEEDLILNGNGTSPQIDGFLHKTGVQTLDGTSDDPQDAIFRAYTLVRYTGRAEPDGNVIHPNDWEAIRLQRTADGIYIFGNPSDQNEFRLWGKQTVVTDAITENTALVGAFMRYSHISRKLGVRVDVSNSHDTYFVRNLLAVRAEIRESLEILRASAFCKVTNI